MDIAIRFKIRLAVYKTCRALNVFYHYYWSSFLSIDSKISTCAVKIITAANFANQWVSCNCIGGKFHILSSVLKDL